MGIDVDILFAGVPVPELGPAAAWYARVLGRPADVVVNDDEVMWRLTETAWLYVVVDPGRAGRALVTLSVADLDAVVADLTGRAIGAGPIEDVGTAGRKAVVSDPWGNRVSLIEVR